MTGIELDAPAPDAPAALASPPASSSPFDERAMLSLYAQGDYEALAEKMIEGLAAFAKSTYATVDRDEQYALSSAAKVLLTLFSQPDFAVPPQHVMSFVQFMPTLANLAAISSFGSTEPFLQIVLAQPDNFTKVLALCSARNKTQLKREVAFEASPELTSIWCTVYAHAYRGWLTDPVVLANMADHFAHVDPRLRCMTDVTEMYFGSTYVDGECDRPIKEAVNRYLQDLPTFRTASVRSRPNPKKIGVVTANWWKGQSVWRTLAPYVKALRPDYHVTLFSLGHNALTDFEDFDESYLLQLDGDPYKLDLGMLADNDFAAIYFPDVGMNFASTFLANLRLAPVQLMGTGHPVSTFGGEIDYFVSGADVEADDAQRHYSERLCLLPGLGAVYTPPQYVLTGRRKRKAGEALINCSWYGQKVNAKLIAAVKQIVDRSSKPLHFRLFTGSAITSHNDLLPFFRQVGTALFPAHVEIMGPLPFAEYMGYMEEADFGIDCWHFGGSNTVNDQLWLRKPVATLEGSRWYGRVGAAMMRRVGVPAAFDVDGWIAMVLDWIDNGPPEVRAADVERFYVESAAEAGGLKAALGRMIEEAGIR